ncbi:Uncharacterised protein [Enterobacter cloacae]|nr:Uncharacterised protein [Enterobacter cloacae]
MLDRKTRQHRVTVMPLRVDRIAPVGVIAPHGIRQKFVMGRVGPVFEMHRVHFVRAHDLLEADNIGADGAYRVAQLR